MESEDRKLIIVFLGLILLVLILIAVLVGLNFSGKNYSKSDSFDIHYNSVESEPLYTTSNKVVYNPDKYGFVVYNRDLWEYSSYGKHSWEKDFVGTYIDEFEVVVKNEEREGNYFEVEFYFEDSDGDIFTENIVKYVRAGEREVFVYKDIQEEKYRYDDWGYKIFVDGEGRENFEKEVKYYEINTKSTVFYDFAHNKCS